MATVDDRVVQLKFDNKQFESATSKSMSTLDKLKQSLNFSSSRKGVDELAGAIGKFNMGNMAATIEGINPKFAALATIGITALSNITNRAVDAGAAILKSFTFDQVATGFHDYETQINAAQTIMANTGLEGAKGLRVVEKTLAELNTYANLTIYDFSAMTENIGRFTAAGVGIKPATDAIKGMSNVAALTGASTVQLGSAMYQMSQALATGTIRLMDWNSLANANLGTKNMQNALIATAHTLGDHGKAMDAAIKKNGNFRDSLQDGWLTTDIFTKAMGVMAGTLDKATGKYRAFTVAELKGKGYTEAQAKSLQKLSQAAIDSAIQIRTMSQMTEALKEGVATAWGAIFKTIFGNLFDATKLWTGLYNILYDVFTTPLYKLNAFIASFKKMGGVTAIVGTVKNAFGALSSIITPLKNAFAYIFPPGSGNGLVVFFKALQSIFGAFKLNDTAMAALQNAFQGLFAIFDIGKQVISGLLGFVKDLFTVFNAGGGKASGGLLAIASSVGLMITNFDKFLKASNTIPAFFDRLEQSMGPVVYQIGQFFKNGLDRLTSAFQGFGGASGVAANGVGKLQSALNWIVDAWHRVTAAFDNAKPFFSNIMGIITGMFQGLHDTVSGGLNNLVTALNNVNWSTIFKVAVGGSMLGIMAAVVKGIWSAINLMFVKPAQVLKAMTGAIDNLGGVLQAWQTNIKAGAMIKIAIAVGLLALSIALLSRLKPEQILQGGAAIAALYWVLTKVLNQMDDMNKSVIIGSASMILMSTALLILAGAVLAFGKMDPVTIGKGLGTITAALFILSAVFHAMPKNALLVQAGVSIMLIAVAMNALAGAVIIYGLMPWGIMLKGLGTILVMLAALAGVMWLFPPEGKMVAAAGSLILIAAAINMLVIPIFALGKMDFWNLVKGIGAIAVVLAILVTAMNLMGNPDAMLGAGALVVMSAALVILGQAISFIGNLPLAVLVVGILGIAAALVVIGLVSLGLSEAIPFVLAFGVAISLLGLGFALVGGGALAFATAMSIVVALLSLGFPILTELITNFIGLIPLLMSTLGVLIISFNNTLMQAFPSIFATIGAFIVHFLLLVQKLSPVINKTIGVLLLGFIAFARTFAPKLFDLGFYLLDQFLTSIQKKLPKIIEKGIAIVAALIEGLGKASGRWAAAAGTALLTFLEQITTWINKNQSRIDTVAHDLVKAIVEGLVRATVSLGSGFVDAIGGLAGDAIDKAKEILHINSPSKVFYGIGKGIIEGWTMGVDQNAKMGIRSVEKATNKITEAFNNALGDIQTSLPNEMNLEPTITPVIDLSSVRKDAKGLSDLITVPALQPTVTAQNVEAISTALATLTTSQGASTGSTEPTKVELTQNNYSPKALSSVEIYRQTKNQISTLKGVLSANSG